MWLYTDTKRLAKVFINMGKHSTVVHAPHSKSYPNPKKEATAYKNLTGKGLLHYNEALI